MVLRRPFVFLFLLWLASIRHAAAGPRNSPDPYTVLGCSKEATQDDIRRQYRKLCLKLHPDKNVNQSPKERVKREELFKRVQDAYNEIGDEDARRRYDQMASFGSSASPFGNSSGSNRDAAEAFYRAYFGQEPYPRQPQQRPRSHVPFYFNGVDISDLFSSRGRAGPAAFWRSSPKSIFVQKVQVPLEDLYRGCDGMEFVLNDNVWKRYRAAFRGGVAASLLYQGILFSLPILRASVPVSLLFGAFLFHVNLPRPTKLQYDVDIQRGWKGGTKLTFKEVEPGFDVVFILEEGKHERFVRQGNDLKTSVRVTTTEAREGCSVVIQPLSEYEDSITVRLRPHEVTHSGQEITLKGKGWPRRKGPGAYGDLIITVYVVPDRYRRRSKSKNK